MDLYTLTDQFLANEPIDDFVSAIWTERYSQAGDCELKVPATPEMITKLAPDTYLALRGSNETMILETQSIEEGLMTVIGRTLDTFLDQRPAWFRNPASSVDDDTARVTDYVQADKSVGEFLSHVVDRMVINTVEYTGEYANVNLSWSLEEIPFLSLGTTDTSGGDKRLTIPVGPLYSGLADIAMKEGMGFNLILEYADPVSGYSLKFNTFKGVDHTTDGTGELVRLVPELDSIQNLKEVHSIALYKNVAYVYYQGIITKHLAEPDLPEPEGLKRRVLITNAEGAPVGHKVTIPTWDRHQWPGYQQTVVGPEDIAAFRAQNARDALANANYIRAIDGQTSPSNDYKFGVDYGLGDLIELQGLTGTISKARITEYIRSQDQSGEREYPTIAVVT
jgi:hypothetical protein